MDRHRDRKNWAQSIRRRGWLLWAVTFAVLLAVTAAVPLLYLPLLDIIRRDPSADVQGMIGSYYLMIGLSGMVLVFCLYTALKQRELERIRDRLADEERETQDVRTRLLELSSMFHVSTTLNLELKLEVILELIVRRVVSALRAQQASVMIYNHETGQLETRATYGLEAEFARNAHRRMGEAIAGRVAECAEPIIINPDGTDDSLAVHFKVDRHITSALSAPMRAGDRCVGVLNVNRINHTEPFEEHHREILHMFADHVAAVIDRAEMMDRLGTRSRELEELNARLSQVNAMKDVFLSTASHELKTPLTSVIAYAELLGENEDRLTREQRSDFIQRLRTEAGRLMALIEDILDLTRLESGKLTLKPGVVSPNDVVRAAIETSRSLAQRRDIEVREDCRADLPAMRLDEVKMGQVVTNLIVNAVKFSPPHGVIMVRTGRDGKYVVIEVLDQGPGIHPDDAVRIFELFGQGASDQKLPESGVGIGLYLVRRITELHGGHVGVNSVLGQGSTFWVRLPIALAQPAAEDRFERAA